MNPALYLGNSILAGNLHPSPRLRHLLAFLATGLLAVSIDAAILTALTLWAGLSPFLARIPAIGCAMVVAWLCNRRLTFGLHNPPHLREFLRYALASGFGVAVNYSIFTVLLLARPTMPPVLALALASIVAAAVSYAGYRWFAFATRHDPPNS